MLIYSAVSKILVGCFIIIQFNYGSHSGPQLKLDVWSNCDNQIMLAT
jgi:hypothetical protein